MRWFTGISPEPDELLTSFLTRSAAGIGLSPHRFANTYLGGMPVWTRDVDRSASDALLTWVVAGTALSTEAAVGLTLRRWEQSLRSPNPSATQGIGTAPWILSAGIFHRVRRSFGLQFCSQCLREHPYYRRAWRLAFITTCAKHGGLLRDRCLRCQHPIIPHRQVPGCQHCHHCGLDLARLPHLPLPQCVTEDASVDLVPRLLHAGYYSGTVIFGGQSISTIEFARGVRVLLSILHQRFGLRILVAPGEAIPTTTRHLQCEQATVTGRFRAMHLIGRMLHAWPHRFHSLGQTWGLTQCCLPSNMTAPAWLAEAIQLLDPGRPWSTDRALTPAAAPATSTLQLRRKLRAIHRAKLPTWRTERAHLLLRTIKRRS